MGGGPIKDEKSAASCFTARRINKTTFLIVENDKWDEWPFIFVKLIEEHSLCVISDTGCGGRPPDDLRTFLETTPVVDNNNHPLNPRVTDGTPTLDYFIICTHCHYDHILGLPSFLASVSPTILASAYDKSFIEEHLPEHSLCRYVDGIETPEYKVSHWAADEEKIKFKGKEIGIQVLHTPGHTPDELAWYDISERHLYVGDSFYQRKAQIADYEQAIVFPEQGNLKTYMASLTKLMQFVDVENRKDPWHRVKIGCGHTTFSMDAQAMIGDVRKFFRGVIDGTVPVVRTGTKRGVVYDSWREDGEPRFSLQAPRKLVEDVRNGHT